MQHKSYTALFAFVMVLFVLPFIPGMLNPDSNSTSEPAAIGPYEEAAAHTIQARIRSGYIGSYTPRPPEWTLRPVDFTNELSGNDETLGYPESDPAGQQARTDTRMIDDAPVFSIASYTSPRYQAQLIEKSHGNLHLQPGQALTVWADFRNTGTETWHRTGPNFIALNVAGPAGRDSVFKHDYWSEYYYRPARLHQDSVAPGETGRFYFALEAPQWEATFHEEFHLVAEHLQWIPGGAVSFRIQVGSAETNAPYYQASEAGRAKGGSIHVDPGDTFTFYVDYKNTGTKPWYNDGPHFIAMNVTDPIGRVSVFKHDYWSEYYYRPARLQQPVVYPGQTGRFTFALQAPDVEGWYTEHFALVVEHLQWIPGSETTLSFKVGDPPKQIPIRTIENEPAVRIGLFQPSEAVTISVDTAYTVRDVSAGTSRQKKADASTTVSLQNEPYIRIVPKNDNAIITVKNYTNKPAWNSDLNDNMFRGNLELRYSEETGETWIINELGVESYLRGLAEVSNGQPPEYLKSLIIAARSYVLWHTAHGGKHPDNHFDINCKTDQVYRGYGFELRSEDPLEAVLATTGKVITHPDAASAINPHGIAIAAYSSGTDGRTRSWGEVWAGSGFPWLVSVDDPYGAISNWDTLEGNHMVGMSAQGARGYATEEGRKAAWILKHYYTGVSVTSLY